MLVNKVNLEIERFASKDSTRPLQGVQVTGEYTEATDGKKLVRVSLPCHEAADFPHIEGVDPAAAASGILPKDVAKATAKRLPKRNAIPIIQNAAVSTDDKGAFQVATTDLSAPSVTSSRPIDGTWPNTDQILKQPEPSLVIGFNGVLLAEVLKWMGTNASGLNNMVKLSFTTADSPVKLSAVTKDGQEITGLVMPLRLKD